MRKILLIAISTLALHAGVFAEEAKAPAFAITSNDFLDEGALPVLYTCDGKDISPALAWTDVPAKTTFFALVVNDPDAAGGTFYHWVAYNIPASVAQIEEGSENIGSGTLLGKNSFGKMQYNGPCPPKGTAHNYVFTLYGLDSKLTLPAGTEGKVVLDAISKHTTGSAKITANYSRWIK